MPGQAAIFTRVWLPDAALADVPHVRATVRGCPITLVRHDLPTYTTLRGRGLLLPPPPVPYTYPGRFTPTFSQRATVEFFVAYRRGFCLNGLGTGKTLAAAWALDYLLGQGEIRRVLIVAPRSVCDIVWERELFQTLPHRTTVLVRGSATRKRQIAADTRSDILIVNPESLSIIADCLPMVDLVVVDEFTKFKNARSLRWRALRKIAQSTRLWMMSGTPTPQSPLDAYGPMRLVGAPGLSALRWRELTMRQVSRFRWLPRDDAVATVAAHLQPAIRFRREECYDLPDVQDIFLDVELTAEQNLLIEQFRAQAAVTFAAGQVTAVNAAAVLTKILQTMAGGVYGADRDGERITHSVEAGPLFDTVAALVEQADTPVLVFAPFRSAVAALHAGLAAAGYRVGLVDGGVTNRAPIFDAFTRGELDVIVAVASTMSHGLTLVNCRYIIWALPPFSAEEYEQANGRVIRQGQTNAVVIYHLVQNALARELFSRLKSKAKLQDSVLNLIRGVV